MKRSLKKIYIGEKKPLVKNLLLLEGISRAGKFLLANILNGFDAVEPVQYHGLLEHIPIFEKLGFIETDVARQILQCEIDTHCYEMLIGRNLNHRVSDKSSIFNVPKYRRYLKRCKESEDVILDRFYKKNLFSLFIMHELMPNIKIYFDTFQSLKVISIKRSPVSLVFSWCKRGLARRIGTDPKLFMIPFRSSKGQIPWFAAQWGAKYQSLSEMDRTIMSICTLFRMYNEGYNHLAQNSKKKILFVHYEDVLYKPKEVIKVISRFLRKKTFPEMKSILKRENLPFQADFIESQGKKLKEIKSLASGEYLKLLLDLEEEYDYNP